MTINELKKLLVEFDETADEPDFFEATFSFSLLDTLMLTDLLLASSILIDSNNGLPIMYCPVTGATG